MDIIDYDTDHTLFVASAADSNDAASNLSFSSQRRLIRKPLPEVPEALTAGVVGGQSYILGRTSSPRRNAITLEQSRERAQQAAIEKQKQLDWWPSTPLSADTEDEKKRAPSAEEPIRTFKLNERYRRHLLNIIESSLLSLGMPSAALVNAIFEALEACLETLGDPAALKALQKSSAFLWRIEALIRSNEQLNGSKVNLKEGGGHKWPRLGVWRGGHSSFNADGTSTEARKRKRDVAMDLLSNAFWMTGAGLGDGVSLSESLKQQSVDPAEISNPADRNPTPAPPKKAAPHLLMKSSLPTVALHTANGSEELCVATKEEVPSSERASVLTTRLAMQLKSSTGSVRASSGQHRHKSERGDEEHRMAVCKISVDFQEDLGENSEGISARFFPTTRRRSGTITLSTKERRHQNVSQGSTRSDQTVRVLDKRGDDVTYRITWQAGRFVGSPLSMNPLSSEDQGRDQLSESISDSRVHLIGGTFVVDSWDLSQEEQDIVKDVLDLGLYAACALLLEGALLIDFGLEEKDDALADGLVTETQAALASALSLSEVPPVNGMTRANTMEAEVDKDKSGIRWKRSIWGIIHYASGEHKPTPLRRHGTLSPRKRLADSTDGLAQAGRFGGYSHRLGKVLVSITGGSGKRVSSATDEAENALRIQEEERSSEPDQEEGQVIQEGVKSSSSPLPRRISPNHLEGSDPQASGEQMTGYMDQLLSEEMVTLTVLEGLDMSLPFGKLANGSAPMPRAPLQSRQSYTDTDGATTTSSTISQSRSSVSSSKPPRYSSGTSESDALRPPLKHASHSQATIESPPNLVDKAQRTVQYYQRAGASKDISLGQSIEEMAAKARVLDREATASKKPKEREREGVHANDEKHKVEYTPTQTYRVAQYLHSRDRISVMASILNGHDATDDVSQVTNDKGDIAAVAKATQMSQDIVRSAIFLAEHLLDVDDKEAGGGSGIEMWSAKVGTNEESRHAFMSEATYLLSYGVFIEAILSILQFASQKYDTARMFRVGNVLLKFQVQPIVVFDLLVEGPVVITRGTTGNETNPNKSRQKSEEKVLERTRLEIRDFYASMKRHITALEHILVARDLDDKGYTVKGPSRRKKELAASAAQEDESFDDSLMEELVSAMSSSEPLSLLSRLKKAFRTTEFELYASLKKTDAVYVNDMRIRFQHAARSAKKRLAAWEEKHLTESEVKGLEPLDYLEPEYFGGKMFAFPGSRFLVREDEPLSIVSYSLSSRAFDEELHRREQKINDVLNWQNGVPTTTQSRLSVSSVATSTAKTSTTATLSTLDPDEDGDFDVAEPVQVNMKRKKRTKDTGILSLTLKRVSSNLSSRSGHEMGDGEGSEEDVTDQMSQHQKQEEELTMTSTASKIMSPHHFDTVSSSNDTFKARVAPVAPKSTLGSMFEGQSTATSTPSQERDGMSFTGTSTDTESGSGLTIRTISDATVSTPKLSAVDGSKSRSTSQQNDSRHAGTGSTFKAPPPSPHVKQSILSGNLKISCISWFAEDFAKLRQKWNINEDFLQSLSRCKSSSVGGGKSKSAFFLTLDGKWIAKQLLNVWSVDEKEAFLEFAPAYLRYMMNSVVNDCPTLLVKIAGVYTLKIKNAKTGETKLKMSVQVLENVFSGDEGDGVRFDIKGIKGRRIPSKKEPTSTEGEERAPVWWDAEYLECFQPRAFVPQAHKNVFRRALHNDLAFLTASNIIDYSLLIGVHEASKDDGAAVNGEEEQSKSKKNASFCVRIVDFLGAFTLVKYIESSGKKAIRSQTPTVIPPHDYATRFAEAVETYFIPCPT